MENILPTPGPAGGVINVETKSPPRILVVDDEPLIRQLNSEVLMDSGYKVDAAEDGEAAWNSIQANHFDLLVTDYDMPKMDGVELLQNLRLAGRSLPTIMATGTYPRHEFDCYPELMPAAILLKPYDIAELLHAVAEVLRAAGIDRRATVPPANGHCQPKSRP